MFTSTDYHYNTHTKPDRVLMTYGKDFLEEHVRAGNVAVIGPSYGLELHELRSVLPDNVTLYGIEINPFVAQYAADNLPKNTQMFLGDGYALNENPYFQDKGIKFSAFFYNNNLLPAMREGLPDDKLARIIENMLEVSDDNALLFVSGNSTHFTVQLTPDRKFVGKSVIYMGAAQKCSQRLWSALGLSQPEDVVYVMEPDPQKEYNLVK